MHLCYLAMEHFHDKTVINRLQTLILEAMNFVQFNPITFLDVYSPNLLIYISYAGKIYMQRYNRSTMMPENAYAEILIDQLCRKMLKNIL